MHLICSLHLTVHLLCNALYFVVHFHIASHIRNNESMWFIHLGRQCFLKTSWDNLRVFIKMNTNHLLLLKYFSYAPLSENDRFTILQGPLILTSRHLPGASKQKCTSDLKWCHKKWKRLRNYVCHIISRSVWATKWFRELWVLIDLWETNK